MNKTVRNIFSFRTLLILGLAACLVCAVPFVIDTIVMLGEHAIRRSLRNIEKWRDIVQHTMLFFATALAFTLFFGYTARGRAVFAGIVRTLRDTFFSRAVLKKLAILAALYFLCYWALIFANYDFADDMRRTYAGHKAWVGWGRYLSETLAVFLHTNFFINDISPLTKLWTIAVLSTASYALAHVATDGRTDWRALLAAALMGTAPFYNVNFAYKFDGPYMALAMLFGVLPFLFTRNTVEYVFVSFISLVAVCTTYQAANSIYIIMTIFVAFKMLLERRTPKETGAYVGISVLCFCAALVYFRVFLMNTFERDPIFNSSSRLVSGGNFLVAVARNYAGFMHIALEYYGNVWIKAFTVAAFALFPVAAAHTAGRGTRARAALLAAAVLVLMLASGFGVYVLLEHTLANYRTFMGLDALVALVALFSTRLAGAGKRARAAVTAVVLCLFYGFCVESNVFGQFYAKQKAYETFRITLLLDDLSRLAKNGVKSRVYIGGDWGQAAKTRMEKKNYNLIAGQTSGLLQYQLKGMNMDIDLVDEIPLSLIDMNPALKEQITALPQLVDTYYHTIYGADDFYFIYLKYPRIKGEF